MHSLKIIPFCIFLMLVILSCSGSKKNSTSNSPVQNEYFTVTTNPDNDSVSMYTDDGHVILFSTDSIGDYVVFYAKFDNNTPGKYDMIKDKIVRIQIDSSQSILRSITSIYGGAFCSKHENFYEVNCFSDQMERHHFSNLNIQYNTDSKSSWEASKEFNICFGILTQLITSYTISCVMNDNRVNGWYNIQTALEPVRQLNQYDFIKSNKVNNNKSLKHINKMKLATEGLNQFCRQLQDLQ